MVILLKLEVVVKHCAQGIIYTGLHSIFHLAYGRFFWDYIGTVLVCNSITLNFCKRVTSQK